MKIASADIAFTAGHALRQQHTREETLVQGVSASGNWNPEHLQDEEALTRRQTQGASFEAGSSLLVSQLWAVSSQRRNGWDHRSSGL